MAAVPVEWIVPPSQGWTYEQVKDFDLPYDWELMDGVIVPRGMTNQWHDQVRDELRAALRDARTPPYASNVERCVMIDSEDVFKPDVVVFDKTGLDTFALECVPIKSVVLLVEVVSHGTRKSDRFTKPATYAEAGVPAYWRVERGEDGYPAVYEYRLDGTGGYVLVAQHVRMLETGVPFPLRVDLRAIMEL